jgi:hypothetical protein
MSSHTDSTQVMILSLVTHGGSRLFGISRIKLLIPLAGLEPLGILMTYLWRWQGTLIQKGS